MNKLLVLCASLFVLNGVYASDKPSKAVQAVEVSTDAPVIPAAPVADGVVASDEKSE